MKRNCSVDILVVDDEVEIADVIAEFLRDEGYTVEVAYDSVSAIEQAWRLWPRLLISDVRMPKISGYELAMRIRQSIKDIRAIFISALSQGLPPPPFGMLLAKPFNFDTLLGLVQQAFNRSGRAEPSGKLGRRSDFVRRMSGAVELAEASR
jgi:CheY-like chemotaxis protein